MRTLPTGQVCGDPSITVPAAIPAQRPHKPPLQSRPSNKPNEIRKPNEIWPPCLGAFIRRPTAPRFHNLLHNCSRTVEHRKYRASPPIPSKSLSAQTCPLSSVSNASISGLPFKRILRLYVPFQSNYNSTATGSASTLHKRQQQR